ncbi:hypothetical protein Trydic_g10464, partial [Trypoxylus dichotomus]
SESPKNISLEWDDGYNLTVRWEHPDRTNGQLRQFQIYVNGKQSLYNVNDEKLNYEQKLNVEILNLTSQQVSVEVKAKNSAGTSEAINRSIYSPPRTSKLAQHLSTKNVKINRFTIEIPEILDIEGNTSVMYIVVSDISNDQIVDRENIHPSEKKLMDKISVEPDTSWVVSVFNLHNIAHREGFSFEVGNDKELVSETDITWRLKNPKLNIGTTYNVSVVLNNTFMEFSRLNTYIVVETTESSEGLEYLLILLLIPLVLSLIFIWRYCMKRYPSISSSVARVSRYTSEYRRRRRNEHDIAFTTSAGVLENEWAPPKLIQVNNLHSYIEQCISDKEFEKQFEYTYPQASISTAESIEFDVIKYVKTQLGGWYPAEVNCASDGFFRKEKCLTNLVHFKLMAVPVGQTKPWVCGTISENRTKNRFTNLAAYDHTRVKLEIIDRDPHSDYINANYIDGYKIEKAYIATQGPKACTVDDFWRMVWQENVEYIVMLANVVECGKKKVEKYWPEVRCAKKFGSVVVEYISVEITANYEIRSFAVFCNREKRHVRQYHYVNWPEAGVPLHLKSLVPFCRKIATLLHGTSPIVVHSSMGIGRTGAFILCDISLCMAKAEGNVNVFHYLQMLREQRCLLRKETGIVCDRSLGEVIENITYDKIQEEMNHLEDIIWQSKAIRDTNAKKKLVVLQEKNRFKNIVPEPSAAVRLKLYPASKESSAYINAVFIDSYQIASKFIATQNPLSSTVPDFWRMVEEHHATTIVSLNRLNFDDPCSDVIGILVNHTFKGTIITFYPMADSYIIEPLPYLEVKYINKEVKGHYEVFDLAMTRLDFQEDDVAIKVIQINSWDYGTVQPENPSDLIKIYEEMNHLGISSDKIILTCYDGARASGLFAALCFLIDRIKLEQICDVSLAVSTVRQSRKQFVTEMSHFSFLYKCALEYVHKFDFYANFDRSN